MEPLCPADGTALARIEVLGRALQSCSQCGGTYLSGADLTALTRLSPRALKLDPNSSGVMVCPNCGEKLSSASAGGQELQACPKCSGVWLGQGGLRRLMSLGNAPAPRVAPRARVWLGGLAGLLLGAVMVTLGWSQMQAARVQNQAEQAWQLRDAAALQRQAELMPQDDLQKLARARARYLEQDFVGCLNQLVGLDSDEARDLLKLAEDGWMAQVAWPGRVLGSLAADLDQDTDRELVRLTDPGFGDPGLELQVLARHKRVYQPIGVEFRNPNGKPLDKPEVPVAVLEVRSERITNHLNALLFLKLKDGRFSLDLLSADEDKIYRYRFLSDTPIKVKDGKILTSEGDYTYQDDHFDRP